MKDDSRIEQVWKWSVSLNELRDFFEIAPPKGAKVISVQNQNEELTFWMVVDPRLGVPREKKVFRICGTGHPIGVLVKNRGPWFTVQFRNGSLVLHVCEEVES